MSRNYCGIFLGLLSGLLASGRAEAQDPANTRMLAQPAISAEHLAFVYDGDLWLANRDGSNSHRLSSHEGTEAAPHFSPDGKTIAFSAEYEGNLDVYVMPISGGTPTRLTWHPAADLVESFTVDGTGVLFSSMRNTFTSRYRKLFTVSVQGGFPTELPIPNGLNAAYSTDGKRIAYNPIGERFSQWKNYRGGTASRIWIYNSADHAVQMIRQPEGRCNDTDPVFIGDRVYFRSDRNGEFNLFSFDPVTEAVEQLTQFADFPINRLTAGSDVIIFEQNGYLHTYTPATQATSHLQIGVTSDWNDRRPRFASDAKWIRHADISPSGARAVIEYRGEIVTLPASKGDMRNLTNTPGVHERSPAWSPDGKTIAWFSDAGGEYRLHLAPQDGKGEVQQFDLEGHGFFEEPKWSPDGTKISYRDNSWSLYLFDVAKKTSTKICSAPFYGPPDVRGLSHQWSPDSRWIVYTNNTTAMVQQAFVYNIDSAESKPITDGLSEVAEPVFDRSGKYIYFLASTDAGPIKDWFAMSNNDMELSNQIYLVVLRDTAENPLKAENDEEKAAADQPTKDDQSPAKEVATSDDQKETADADKSKVEKVEIDFDGLDQRIVAIPVEASVYSNLQSGDQQTIYFIKRNRDGKSELGNYSIKEREANTVLAGATGFSLSADGKKVLYSIGSSLGIAAAGNKIEAGKGDLSVDKILVKIDPVAEWNQIFEEVWRINRDYFYDPNMHGSNWEAMREKYRPFVAHCATREDLNRVLKWMCSELAVGHHRVGGGDDRLETKTVPGGLLGADFEIAEGRYRFKKVLGGLNYNGSLRAPLTEPGVRVRHGEYLLAVNGVDLLASDNVYRHFENTAGRIVELKVGPKADGSDSRLVSVVPIENESELRNRDWIEGNLRRVTEATNGRVAYVYVPDTAGGGHSYFKRYFFPQADREAIIIDERFNGGGQIADYHIDHLRRPYVSHWATRYGGDIQTPTSAIPGPKIMLIDETAGSGGDMLPWMFHKLEIGTLVGRRTWGGLVGILGFPELMDGGSVTAPNIAIWTEDGFVVENVGVPPDVEVEQLPAEVIAGHDPQLEKAIEIALKQLAENPPKKYQKPPFPIRSRNSK